MFDDEVDITDRRARQSAQAWMVGGLLLLILAIATALWIVAYWAVHRS